VVLVALVALVARVTGVADLAADTSALADGGLLVALVLGLAAGVSTCAALVGGLVLALSASFQAGPTGTADLRTGPQGRSAPAPSGLGTRLRPALVFVGGRIAGYGLLGALLGAIGAGVTMPPAMTAVLMIVAAVVMAVAGARLTGLSPRIAAWSPTLPMGLGRRLGLVPSEGDRPAYSDLRAGLLGAATFFLPCGFTQAVQVFALSTGSPLIAGAVMAVFAIGTAPGLLAMAGLPIVVPGSFRPTLLRIAGVAVLAFALLNATAGLRLAGIPLPDFGPGTAEAAALPAAEVAGDGTQALTTYQDAGGYSPGMAAIYAGAPTRWTIQSSTVATCAASLVVPSLGISVRLHEGANTIDLPALPVGRLDYSCAMGMYGGSISVIAPGAGAQG
jgi:sulfite exporter TauE/SafE